MAQWILKANVKVVPRRTYRPLHTDEIHSEQEKKKREVFDTLIETRWGSSFKPPVNQENDAYAPYEDDEEEARYMPDIEEVVDSTGKSLDQQPVYDKIINVEVSLQQDEQLVIGKVKRRVLGPDGHVVGKYDNDQKLNSIVYEVGFPDGQVKDYAANIIAENIAVY
eukprot:10930806-Ditylum_brightwellii.AAC.1